MLLTLHMSSLPLLTFLRPSGLARIGSRTFAVANGLDVERFANSALAFDRAASEPLGGIGQEEPAVKQILITFSMLFSGYCAYAQTQSWSTDFRHVVYGQNISIVEAQFLINVANRQAKETLSGSTLLLCFHAEAPAVSTTPGGEITEPEAILNGPASLQKN